MTDKDRLPAAIATVATLHGEFTLRSGAVSNEYFDKYRFESDPALLKAIAEHLAASAGIALHSLFNRRDLSTPRSSPRAADK